MFYWLKVDGRADYDDFGINLNLVISERAFSKKPLFLGGGDAIENLELSDLVSIGISWVKLSRRCEACHLGRR